MSFSKICTQVGLALCSLACVLSSTSAFAAVSFVSATNAATLADTIDDEGKSVFVFSGVADGESTVLTFSTDSACPKVAMTGGAEFTANWSCVDGEISATVTNRGGMSFGPSPDGNQGTFYVTFSDPPAPPGLDAAPEAMSGIQIAVFGDVSSWNMSGEATSAGAAFGVELSGTSGGEAHFRMDLPSAAVTYLGGVLGIYVGGKLDPFSTVTTNSDESASIKVDIASLKSASASKFNALANLVTKKITTGARTLGVAFAKSTVKSGKSVNLAMCSGLSFVSGAKVPVKFTVGGKDAGIKKTFVLDSSGCASGSIKIKSSVRGTLTAQVTYKGKKAKATTKVTK